MGESSGHDDTGREHTDPTVTTTTVAVAMTDARGRAQVAAAIAAAPDLELVGEAEGGSDALELITLTVPDVALVDLQLQDPDGLEVCAQIAESLPVVRVLLTAASDDQRSYGGVSAGAVGCVPEVDLAARVVEVVRRVAWGEAMPPQGWAERMLAELDQLDGEGEAPVVAPTLTATELEVLTRLAAGSTPVEVAAMHGVPVRQVNLHAAFAIGKLRRYHRDLREIGTT